MQKAFSSLLLAISILFTHAVISRDTHLDHYLSVIAEYAPDFSPQERANLYYQVLRSIDEQRGNVSLESATKDLAEKLQKGFGKIIAHSDLNEINDPKVSETSLTNNEEQTKLLFELIKNLDNKTHSMSDSITLLSSLETLLAWYEQKNDTAAIQFLSELQKSKTVSFLNDLLQVADILQLPKDFVLLLTEPITDIWANNLQATLARKDFKDSIKNISRFLGKELSVHPISFPPKIKLLHTLRHNDEITSAAFSPDGKQMVTTSADSIMTIWNTDSGKSILILQDDNFPDSSIFSPDGTKILSWSDTKAKLWDARTGNLISTLTFPQKVISVAFNNTSSQILTTYKNSNTADVWDSASGALLFTLVHAGKIRTAVFSHDSKKIVTASRDKTANIWDAQTGTYLNSLVHTHKVNSAAFSSDGLWVVTTDNKPSTQIWDNRTGAIIKTIPHKNKMRTAIFSPDNAQIVTLSNGNRAYLWGTKTGKLQHIITHKEWITSIAIKPQGNLLITASEDHTAKIWDMNNGKCIHTLSHTQPVIFAALSPNGNVIASLSEDDTAMKIWKLRNHTTVPAAEYLVYRAFVKSQLPAVKLAKGSYGAKIVNQLNNRMADYQPPIIPVVAPSILDYTRSFWKSTLF